MAKKDEELEDEIELEEDESDGAEEQDEKDSDEEGSEEAEKDSKKKDEEDTEEDPEEDNEEGAEKSEKEDVSPEREAIRERRRREKKMRRERERREKLVMAQTIKNLSEEVNHLKKAAGGINKKFEEQSVASIDNEIRELNSIYQNAQRVMESAIADSDGKKFAEAKSVSDRAWARYNMLQVAKQNLSKKEKEEEQEEQVQTQKQPAAENVLSEQGKRYAMGFINKNKSWYDPNGGNRESKIVMTIDSDLYEEGYDPNDKDYWEELEARVAEVFPDKIKSKVEVRKKTPSIVGGTTNESFRARTEKALPKEFVQTLKAAGFWDDADKRKKAIKDFYANKKKG